MSAHFCYVQIIKNWLNGSQNFRVGVTLYNTFGTNPALKNLLAKGETPFCKNLLIEELQKLIDKGIPVELPVEPIQKEVGVMPDSADGVLQALKNEWMPVYQEMQYKRHQLDKEFEHPNSEAAITYRKPLAFEILALEQQCIQIWAKRDYYVKEGKLPFVPETKLVVPTDPTEVGNMIYNIKRYIRRERLKLKKEPGNAKVAQRYKEFLAQHKQLIGEDYEEKE